MFLLVAAAHAACPAPAAALDPAVQAVERAFAALDAEGVARAGAELDTVARCLDSLAPQARMARVHAAHGLVAFVAGDEEGAAQAFAAARRVEPGWRPDPALVPKGHPIHALALRLDPEALGASPPPPPAEGAWGFDGALGVDRPEGAPVVAQWVVDDVVRSGAYVWPTDPLPPFDPAAPRTPSRTTTRPSPAPWIGVGLGGAAASAVSFVLADRARTAWESAETGGEVVKTYRENHLWMGLGGTFGAVALVGGVGAVATVAF